nr:PREDICTED: cGMP-dependent protein kinase 1-like [Paralichthys olivaceus]
MEKQLEELKQQLEKQCLINQELQRHNTDLEKRLQEKEKLLQELQSQYHDLGKRPMWEAGVKYQDKDVIVREGAEANTFYIILKGEVLVTKNVNGLQKHIRRMGKGEHFGEQALIREVLRTATCTADGPVTCFSIDKEVFEETIPIEHLELFDDSKVLQEAQVPEKSNPTVSTMRFKDLVPVLYQEGRYQGEPVTLGVGGFGRVELVRVFIPPFSSSEPQKIYAKILDGVLKYPPYLSEAAKSIISKLCRPRPGQRLGNTKNGIKDVRHHRLFSSMNWHKLRVGQLDAPTVRLIRKGPCYINFDKFPLDQTTAEEEFSGWDRDF